MDSFILKDTERMLCSEETKKVLEDIMLSGKVKDDQKVQLDVFGLVNRFEKIIRDSLDSSFNLSSLLSKEDYDICQIMVNLYSCFIRNVLIENFKEENIIKIIVEEQKKEFFDIVLYEKLISSKLDRFIGINDFCEINIGSLLRIFHDSPIKLKFGELLQFFEKYYKKHQQNAFLLLPVIKNEEGSSIREIFIDHIKEKEVADLKAEIAELKNVIQNKDQPSVLHSDLKEIYPGSDVEEGILEASYKGDLVKVRDYVDKGIDINIKGINVSPIFMK